MKKVFLVFAVCIGLLGSTFGQWNLRLSTMIPSGNYYPYVLKPGFGLEFTENVHLLDNDYYKPGVAVGLYFFRPTQDTFRTYAVGGSYTTNLLPGYEVVHSYIMVQAGISNEFIILPDKPFTPIVGLDLFIDAFDISEDTYTETLVSSKGGGDIYYNYSIVPRVGFQYVFKKSWLLTVGLARSMGFGGEIGTQAFWEPFITIGFDSER